MHREAHEDLGLGQVKEVGFGDYRVDGLESGFGSRQRPKPETLNSEP